MSDLTIAVDGAPGANCTDIIRQMCCLSSRLGIDVMAKLNGVTTTATPFCDIDQLCIDWQERMNSKDKYKFACGHPMELRAVGKEAKP